MGHIWSIDGAANTGNPPGQSRPEEQAMPYGLTFGTEFECFIPRGSTREQLAAAISARLSAFGQSCKVENYGHNATPHWKIVPDGSLGDYTHGVEVVSRALPPLQGEEGIKEMRAVCEALTDFGCTVNKDAGMHVHVGVAGMGLGFFKKAVRLYQTYEKVIDGIMPMSRRNSTNTFTRSLLAASPAAINQAASISDLAYTIQRASRAGEPRYHKVNVTAFNRHKTIEFRQHSGTVDATKSENWVRICWAIVEAAKNDAITFETATQASAGTFRNTARRGSKRHTIVEMIMRPQGASRTEIVEATQWPSVSIAQIAASTGLPIVTTRIGRETRYSVNAVATAAPTIASSHDVSVDGFCTLLALSGSVREYVTQRTANLGGPIAWAA
jgi:hypothetical protein